MTTVAGAATAASSGLRVTVLRKLSLLDELRRGVHRIDQAALARAMKSPELNASHENNERCVESAERELSRHGLRVDVVEVLSTAHVARSSLVVAVGGDGTFLQATHKFAEGVTVPILGVNSSPSSSVGFFCVCNETSFADVIREWLEGRTTLFGINRMRIFVNGQQNGVLATNDVLFASDTAATTAKYRIVFQGRTELQRSSGVWIATAAGSTAAIAAAGGAIEQLDSRRLQFLVRELSPERRSAEAIRHGFFERRNDFSLETRVPAGKLYIDGYRDLVNLGLYDTVQFEPSEKALLSVRRATHPTPSPADAEPAARAP